LTINDKEDRLLFPLPRYKFEKGRDRRFILDQIQLKNLIQPLFYVSHGVKDVEVNCNKVNAENRFLVLSEDYVSCKRRFDYDHYIDNNRIVHRHSNRSSTLDMNMFMSIDEILELKIKLKVQDKCVKKTKEKNSVVKIVESVHDSDFESDSDFSSSIHSIDSEDAFDSFDY